LDEAEHYVNPHERQSSDLVAVLNAGYRRGAKAIMVADAIEELPDGTKRSVKKPIAIDTFSLKAIASRRDIYDTLEDRSVQIIMPKHGRNLGPIDEKYAEALRGRLLQYRLDCLKRNQPLRAKLPSSGDARLNEILEPLYAVTPQAYRQDYHVILTREKALRLERIRETYEYAVLEAFATVVTEDMQDASLILTETVADAYNQRHASRTTTNRSIGRTLARLGFKSGREDDKVAGRWVSRRGYLLNRSLLSRLKSEYGFDEDLKIESETQPTLEALVTEDQGPALPSSPATTRRGILPSEGKEENRQLSPTNAGNDGNAGNTDKQEETPQ
jgi:hypothetical protein